MTLEEALQLVDELLKPHRMSTVQDLVFRACWEGQTYQAIAESAGYAHDYIRTAGSQLWQQLSEALEEKITKNNFQAALRDYQRHHGSLPKASIGLEFPTGQVPLESPFYIERLSSEMINPETEEPLFIENQCYRHIQQPGQLIRIKAPRQMGKTSLMARILYQAHQQNYQTVALSLQQADLGILKDLDRFLTWFCATVTRDLGLDNKLEEYWDDVFGSNGNCTDYFEHHILPSLNGPLVLAIDEVDEIFKYPELAFDFLGLLRAWYEKAKYGVSNSSIWQRLRIVVVHSTEVYIPLNVHRSPFNVGFSVELPEFTHDQVQILAQRHGLTWSNETETAAVNALMTMVGGYPYLVRLALYHLAQGNQTLASLLNSAPTDNGIYQHDLQRRWRHLQQYPKLADAYGQVVRSSNPIDLDQRLAFELESLGLTRLTDAGVTPSCQLYRDYFRDRLTTPVAS
ncbi:MAG: AAA-like domain-containing protein [Cyanobacteria bacterium J06639_16]